MCRLTCQYNSITDVMIKIFWRQMVNVTFIGLSQSTVLIFCSFALQLQVAYAKGLLKGKTAVESQAKKSFINNVVSRVVSLDISCRKFPEIYSNLSGNLNFRRFLLKIQYKPSEYCIFVSICNFYWLLQHLCALIVTLKHCFCD